MTNKERAIYLLETLNNNDIPGKLELELLLSDSPLDKEFRNKILLLAQNQEIEDKNKGQTK